MSIIESLGIDPILRQSASRLATRIREGEITSEEVVERHIERIEEVNPRLNAVVRDRFERARAEAKQADEAVRRGGPLPPLHGVPCTVKESLALEGMPHSSGMRSRAGTIASGDATVVARIRKAGAIPLGVTNLPELATDVVTYNKVYGRTCNAYSPRHIAGGSSGGEGAIVGAGGSPFGLGTDIGGSIRIPAFCNGVFGHKPTGGLVPGTGQYPQFTGDVLRKNTTGPLARRAEDLMPLLQLLAGPDGSDAGCQPRPLGDPGSVDVSRLRVWVVEGRAPGLRVDRGVRETQQRAADALAQSGADVGVVEIEELRDSLAIYVAVLLEAGGLGIPEALGGGREISLWRELGRLLTGRSDHTRSPLFVGLVLQLAEGRTRRRQKGIERGRALARRLESLLGPDGVLLYPSSIGGVPKHGLVAGVSFPFCGIFNALELPVTQVPLGLGPDGLPLGIQVVGGNGCDHVTIAVARRLEEMFGGWTPPEDD